MDNRLEDSLNDIYYVIDHSVIFYPGQHRLVYRSEGEEINARIFIPTSRCLLLLLEGDNKIIRREEFIKKVWVENGCCVANNTFYQNISMLRKLLQKAGLNKDIIITIPKRGLKMSNATHVEINRADKILSKSNALTLQGTEKKLSDNQPLHLTDSHRNYIGEKFKSKSKIKVIFLKSIISSLILGGAIGALMAGTIINREHTAYEIRGNSDIHTTKNSSLAISKKTAPIDPFKDN